MKQMPDETLEKMRLMAFELEHYGFSPVGTACGVFAVRRHGATLRFIASDADACRAEGYPLWEHVSVSARGRCPTWEEMEFAKRLFWRDDEAVMQLHPPRDQWVNNHPYCLHLWRPVEVALPLPPAIMVGVKSAGLLRNAAEARQLRESIQS